MRKIPRSNWSIEARTTPTFTKSIQAEYYKKLNVLFQKFHAHFLHDLEKKHDVRMHTLADAPAIQATIRSRIKDDITDPSKNIIEYTLKTAYKSGLRRAQTHLKSFQIVGVDPNIGFADWRVLDALRVRNLQNLQNITDDMETQIISALDEGIRKGEGAVQLGKRIEERVGVSRSRAEMFARTETNFAHNQAAEIRYSQAGITKLEWMRGGVTDCDVCDALEGIVFDVRSDHVRPPQHPNCMCTLLPVLEDE